MAPFPSQSVSQSSTAYPTPRPSGSKPLVSLTAPLQAKQGLAVCSSGSVLCVSVCPYRLVVSALVEDVFEGLEGGQEGHLLQDAALDLGILE